MGCRVDQADLDGATVTDILPTVSTLALASGSGFYKTLASLSPAKKKISILFIRNLDKVDRRRLSCQSTVNRAVF